MRLLILTPQLPYPPHQGTSIRNYNLIRQLAARHRIHLLSFAESTGQVMLDPLRECCALVSVVAVPPRRMVARVRDSLCSSVPDMGLRLESETMHHQLHELLRRGSYDVIQVEGIEMGPYLLQISREPVALGSPSPARPPIVFDDHNCEYLLQRRAFETDLRQPARWMGAVYSLLQWRKLARYERHCCNAADRVTVVSEADRDALEGLVPELTATVVANGVDLSAYDPQSVVPLDLGPAALVFTGKMDFRPNVDGVLWFAERVLPLVRTEVPEAHFYVVGQRPHPRLKALQGRPDVTVTGFVPQTEPYIAGATTYVVPLRMGGGTRLKLLEAMALGKPVVSTRLGCEGFALLRADEHLLVADDAVAFAQAVIALLGHPFRGHALGRAARELVIRHYDWSAVVPRLEEVYAHALAEASYPQRAG